MTKKDFKEKCSFHEYGKGKEKRNAIYYDWSNDYENNSLGFKYMVKASVENSSKAELFNILYEWVIKMIMLPWWVTYRFAETEQNRFKVSIMG